jgi:hypothetical protein
MIFGRRVFGVERAIVLLFGGLAVFGYFYMRLHIDDGVTIFRVFLNLGYSWKIFISYRDLSEQVKF